MGDVSEATGTPKEILEKKIDISGDGGVIKEILKEGAEADSPRPLPGCTVSLHYTGSLVDGTVFDSSVERGEPFEFNLDSRSVIKAFDMGVASMKLGECCRLTCAPEYAYGSAGSPPKIPPNATLIFELELLGWKGQDISPKKDGSIERFIVEASEKKRTPVSGANIKVHIIGKYDDKVFEDREVEFAYGEGSASNIVEGLEIALMHIAVGETSRIKIQPIYAFGSAGNEELGVPPNATVEYTIKLIECERLPEEWKLNDEERIKQSESYKERGTNYFKKLNYPLAIKMYNKCISILPEEGEHEAMKTLRIAANSNIALCYQKTNDHFEGKQACNKVLQLDPNNIKALYRRGQCNLAVNEYHEALEDFQNVVKLEPSNKAAANQIATCKRKIKESNDREKKIYANMFTKLAAADKQSIPISDEPDVLTRCGEWTDEDVQREADLAFERDNNIVMI